MLIQVLIFRNDSFSGFILNVSHSYVVKYGEVFFDFPFESELSVALAFIFIPSMLNAFKWYKRSKDPSFEGWF